MVRTLQKKFIRASMLAVTILLLTLVGAINLLHYISVSGRQERLLDMLFFTDAKPWRVPPAQEGPSASGIGRTLEGAVPAFGRRDDAPAAGGNSSKPEQREIFDRGRRFSMDEAMSLRFFAVWLDSEGRSVRSDVSRIYAVDEEEAVRLAEDAASKGRAAGCWKGFRYLSGEKDPALQDGSCRLFVAMDVSGDSRELWSVLGISFLIAVLCWLLMLIPVYALSSRAIAPTVQGLERQKQFITNAGHELKTPLAIIQANAEALELFAGESKWTRNILSQTDRLGDLMQDLLTLARMDEAGMQVKMEDFDFSALVREAWEPFTVAAASRELSVEFDPGDGGNSGAETGVRAHANRENTARILSILFDNAVKYTLKGGGIHIAVSSVPGGVQLLQSNTVDPAGFPENADRLFERFYRADNDRSRKKGGYGIGLSAAKALAEANRGQLIARTEGGRICFTLVLRGAPA